MLTDFLSPPAVYSTSSLLLHSCILHMLPPTQCALLTLYLLLCCLQAKATCEVELLLHLLQSCCLCCVWTFPLCCLTCLDLFFLCGQGPFTFLCICSILPKWNFKFWKSLEDLKYSIELCSFILFFNRNHS